jgi:hypothetical protein
MAVGDGKRMIMMIEKGGQDPVSRCSICNQKNTAYKPNILTLDSLDQFNC